MRYEYRNYVGVTEKERKRFDKWLADRTTLEPVAGEREWYEVASVYADYVDWCSVTGREEMDIRLFGMMLPADDYPRTIRRGHLMISRVGLKTVPEPLPSKLTKRSKNERLAKKLEQENGENPKFLRLPAGTEWEIGGADQALAWRNDGFVVVNLTEEMKK